MHWRCCSLKDAQPIRGIENTFDATVRGAALRLQDDQRIVTPCVAAPIEEPRICRARLQKDKGSAYRYPAKSRSIRPQNLVLST